MASYLSDKASSVSMVGTTKYPYERTLGPEIGKMTMQVGTYKRNDLSDVRTQVNVLDFKTFISL